MLKKTVLFSVLVTLLLSCVLSWSCGKKGPLKLEPEILPRKPQGVKLFQVGYNLRVEWTFPPKLSDNKTDLDPLKVTKIEIRYSDKEIKHGKFKKKSKVLRKLTMKDASPVLDLMKMQQMEKMTSQQRKKMQRHSYYADIPFDLKDLDGKVHFVALRFFYGKKKSPYSKVEALQTIPPIKPITDLTISQENKLIKLKWTRPEMDVTGKPLANIAGYNIYRKVKGKKRDAEAEDQNVEVVQEEFIRFNISKVLEEYFEDRDTGTDGDYQYYVTTTFSGDIESAPSPIVSTHFTDKYPPDIPSNLVVFEAPDHMFLSWKAVSDKDLSHYRVYRKTSEDDEFTLLEDNVTGISHKDSKLKKGITYYYCVTAVDVRGNESEYSNTVEEEY